MSAMNTSTLESQLSKLNEKLTKELSDEHESTITGIISSHKAAMEDINKELEKITCEKLKSNEEVVRLTERNTALEAKLQEMDEFFQNLFAKLISSSSAEENADKQTKMTKLFDAVDSLLAAEKQLRVDLDSQRDKHRTDFDDMEHRYQSELEQVKQEWADLESSVHRYQGEIEKLNRDHQAEMESSEHRYKGELEQVQNNHSAELKNNEQRYKDELEQLKNDHQAELASVEHRYKEKLEQANLDTVMDIPREHIEVQSADIPKEDVVQLRSAEECIPVNDDKDMISKLHAELQEACISSVFTFLLSCIFIIVYSPSF